MNEPAPRDRIAATLWNSVAFSRGEYDWQELSRVAESNPGSNSAHAVAAAYQRADALIRTFPGLAAEPTTGRREPDDEEIARLWRKYVTGGSLPNVDGLRAMWREGADFADITASEIGDTPWDREAFKAALADARKPETPDLHNSIRSAALAPEPADTLDEYQRGFRDGRDAADIDASEAGDTPWDREQAIRVAEQDRVLGIMVNTPMRSVDMPMTEWLHEVAKAVNDPNQVFAAAHPNVPAVSPDEPKPLDPKPWVCMSDGEGEPRQVQNEAGCDVFAPRPEFDQTESHYPKDGK